MFDNLFQLIHNIISHWCHLWIYQLSSRANFKLCHLLLASQWSCRWDLNVSWNQKVESWLTDGHIDIHFLDAIASPTSYPCQCASQSVSQSVIDSFRFGDSYRISELCELVMMSQADCWLVIHFKRFMSIFSRSANDPGALYLLLCSCGETSPACNPFHETSLTFRNFCSIKVIDSHQGVSHTAWRI